MPRPELFYALKMKHFRALQWLLWGPELWAEETPSVLTQIDTGFVPHLVRVALSAWRRLTGSEEKPPCGTAFPSGFWVCQVWCVLFFPIGALSQGRESHGLDHSSPVWILSFHRKRQTREEQNEKDRHAKNTGDEQQRKARWVRTAQPACRPGGL